MESSLLDTFLKPSYVASFHSQPLLVTLFTSDGKNEVIELNTIYPFMTIQNIKTLIYLEKNKDPDFHPSFQCLLIPAPISEAEHEVASDSYIPAEFIWMKPGGNSQSDLYALDNPLTIQTADIRFVTSAGSKRIVGYADRAKATIEDVLISQFGTNPIVLHLFLYKDILSLLDQSIEGSEREWFGKVGPYFPELSPGQLDTPAIDQHVTYMKQTLQLLERLDSLIEGVDLGLLQISITGVKFLRLVWKEPTKIPDLENLFYELPVTEERPFLRILPADSQPITKLKLAGVLKIPDISDPTLLIQWAQERSPTPEKDFVFSKIKIRKTVGTQPALYGTLRIFDDKTGDFIIMPPKQVRILDPKSDLNDFASLLQKALEDTPFEENKAEIGEATLTCGLRLTSESERITKANLKKRIAAFSPFFQEIAPLPGEQPLMMLRYKAVSNFANEDRIFSFLTQLANRKLLQGEAQASELVEILADEFQLSEEDAKVKVADWFRKEGQSELAVPEAKDYIMKYNKGIDVAIFAQHPFYSFHLYRVDSSTVLSRILTLLSILFSAEDSQLSTREEFVRSYQVAETVVEQEEEFIPDATVPVATGEFDNLMFDEEFEDLGEAKVESPQRNVEKLEEQVLAPPRVAKREEVQEEEEKEEEDDGKKSYAKWLVKKLQEADRRLFEYKGANPSVKIQKYVTKCQATETRQPAVLSQDQYERMRSEYAEDDVSFMVYPLELDEPEPPEGSEVYTVLKYGSDPLKQSYYLCSEYFCIKDHILVREHDLNAEKDRKGRPKKKGTCPFCKGEIIKNLKEPAKNETVIHRKTKPRTENKRHLYIGFLKDTPHPEGFYLPCCFLDNSVLRISDKQFEHIRAAAQVAPEGDEEEPVSAATGTQVPMISYPITFAKAHRKYIVGPEKFPLKVGEIDGPQIGLVLSVVDTYFGQNPKDFVSREFNRMELKPESKGFLRIGVENRSRYLPDSFFSCIAPFLGNQGVNTATDVKAIMIKNIPVRIFVSLNFGNLVLEFYDPAFESPMPLQLSKWAYDELGIEDVNDRNRDALTRLWKSYEKFKNFIESSTTLKEYRQFAQVLALPRLITSRGLVCIVLDINEKEEIEVRCPPYGYDSEQYAGSDIVFLTHHYSGVWEPIFYTDNRPATAQFAERHESTIAFQRAQKVTWPPIVSQRIKEFMSRCSSSGRSMFTSQSKMDPYALVTVANALQGIERKPFGVIRDAYNHVVGLTFRVQSGKIEKLVALPVIDDGTMTEMPQKFHFDWDDYDPAPIDDIVRIYKRDFENVFSLYPGYKVLRRVKSRGTGKYVAVQLANGLYIPASPPKIEAEIESLPLVEVNEMEWSLNKEIAFGKETEDLFKAEEDEMKEIFEHLRLTFSNWLSSEQASSEVRTTLEKIIFSRDLPLFEKRKRLEILYGKTVLSWLDTDIPVTGEITSLLRADCRLKTQPACTGRCVWRQEGSRCLLHTVKDAKLGSRTVNGPRLLMWRLFEELLRFPQRRQEILKKGGVPTLVALKDAVKMGDQWILPESSTAWYDLMRSDWMPTGTEKKKFFEEMSSTKRVQPVEERKETEGLPDELLSIIGPTTDLYLYYADGGLKSYLTPYGASQLELDMEEGATALTQDAIKKFVILHIKRPVIQINLTTEPIDILSYSTRKEQRGAIPYVIVVTPEGTALLSSSPKFYEPIDVETMPSGLTEIYADRTMLGK